MEYNKPKLKIYDCFIDNGQEPWEQLSMSFDSLGKFNIDYDYKPVLHFINNINNENIINKTEINNSNKNFSIESNINIIENKNIRIFADISNLGLQDILNKYDYELKGEDNLADIYYYIYHYMLSGNKEGKYSSNFIDKNKNSKNIRYAK